MSPGTEAAFSISSQGMDLAATLSSGQSFSWRREGDGWQGWIEGRPCFLREQEGLIHAAGPSLTAPTLRHYLGLDLPLEKIFSTFPGDPWLERARAFAPGLRILRQEPWETLCNFICSSLKQIVQIEQINRDLRQAFGTRTFEGYHHFPEASLLALRDESELRACRLGFRARHLFVAARQIQAGEVSLAHIGTLPTDAAREELRRIRGVGTKVANCILLFAYGRLEAFPIDVWVERVLRRLYFKGRARSHDRMRLFAEKHFGPYGGYAQQFLFHWIRRDPGVLPERKKKRPRPKAKLLRGQH